MMGNKKTIKFATFLPFLW